MTYDEILSMTPVEVQEAIARKKGYERKHGWMDAACINPMEYWVTPKGRLTSVLPDWPTDIVDAWNLVEEIRESKSGVFEIGIDTDRHGDDTAQFRVTVFKLRDNNVTGTGWTQIVNIRASTISLAISQAWLMWKEKIK